MLLKIQNLNYLLIFLSILITFIGAAGLYSADTDKSCLLDIILTVYKNIAWDL